MIAYLTFLVKILKRYSQIDLYFLNADHTKFGSDGHFGNIKSRIKNINCYNIKNLIGIEGLVQSATNNGRKNFEVLYKDPIAQAINFKWYEWKKYFEKKLMSV